MKLPLLILAFSLLSSVPPVNKVAAKTFDGKAFATSTQMDFTDSTQAEIDSYYGDVTGLLGDNLKDHLYNVISDDNNFITYDKAWDWYKITDRNWSLSQTIDPATYTFDSDTKDNHYLYLMYFEESANNSKTKAINQKVNGFKTDSSVSGVDWENSKRQGAYWAVDREHVWAKNHGFKLTDSNGDVLNPGAPTDLHHLVAADHMTNSQAHNDYYYGNVNHDNADVMNCYYADGTTGISGWREKIDGEYVFEPTDEWKGDVARCLFYMATRYGKDLGVNGQEEPYLIFTDDGASVDNNAIFHGGHENLDDFLEWNELDPVSDYEIHRNNLIYKNVQKNRNPFIDNAKWARMVFAPDTVVLENDFSKLEDKYQIHCGESQTLPIEIVDTESVTVEISDPKLVSLSSDMTKITANSIDREGSAIITFHYKDKNGDEQTASTTVEVKTAVKVASLFDTAVSLEVGTSYMIQFTTDGNCFDNEAVVLRSTNESVATITSEGYIKAISPGECVIQIVLTNPVKGDKILSEIEVVVNPDKRQMYIMIIIIAAVLLIAIFLVFFFLIRNTNKKGGKKTMEEYVKTATKIYKKTTKKSGRKKK